MNNFFAPQDNPKFGAGVFVVCQPTGNCLFLKRSDDEGWCTPGGGVNFGEGIKDAAIREFSEEAGVSPDLIRVTSDVPYIRQNPDGLIFHTYPAVCSEEFVPHLNHEHTDHAWVTPYKHPEPIHPGVAEYMRNSGLL